jgi:hypothetical protein
VIAVIVVGEGQTEQTFVRDVLAPPFADLNISLQPRLVETSPDSKGGSLRPNVCSDSCAIRFSNVTVRM